MISTCAHYYDQQTTTTTLAAYWFYSLIIFRYSTVLSPKKHKSIHLGLQWGSHKNKNKIDPNDKDDDEMRRKRCARNDTSRQERQLAAVAAVEVHKVTWHWMVVFSSSSGEDEGKPSYFTFSPLLMADASSRLQTQKCVYVCVGASTNLLSNEQSRSKRRSELPAMKVPEFDCTR